MPTPSGKLEYYSEKLDEVIYQLSIEKDFYYPRGKGQINTDKDINLG